MWLDIMLALSCAATGAVCGWIGHAFDEYRIVDLVKAKQLRGKGANNGGLTAGSLMRIADDLRQHAKQIYDDVDAHQSIVDSINDDVMNSMESEDAQEVAEVLRQIIDANSEMQQQLQSAQDKIHRQTLELESAQKKADMDALTLIPNRGAFDRHIADRHAVGPEDPYRSDAPQAGTFAILDVDHFKRFNDDHGHLAGDEVLRTVAGLLHSRLNGYGIVARYGGEEFAIMLDDTKLNEAEDPIERARQAIAELTIPFEGKSLQVTASIGMAQLKADESVEEWIARADEALYASKDAGRDCTHAHCPTGIRLVKTDQDDSGPTPEAKPSGDEYGEEREAMRVSFEDMRTRGGEEIDVCIAAMRIAFEDESTEASSVLSLIRSTLRDVDKISCHDRNTLVIAMPSMDMEAAQAWKIKMNEDMARMNFGGIQSTRIGVEHALEDASYEDLLASVFQQVE